MSTLEYDAVGHRYSVGGVEIPSVTRVISDVLMGEKQWADEAAMWRGSVVHKVCELDDRGTLDEGSIDPAAAGYVDAWRKAKGELGFEFEEIEQPHFSEKHRFAGRLDRKIIEWRGLLVGRCVLDLKSMKRPSSMPPQVAIQLAAYCILTDCYGRVAVRLTPDGRYQLTIYPVAELQRDKNIFLASLTVAKCSPTMNSFVGALELAEASTDWGVLSSAGIVRQWRREHGLAA